MEVEVVSKLMSQRGWVILPEMVPPDLLSRMQLDIGHAYFRCREIQLKHNLPHTEGTVHHLIGQEDSFLDYLIWAERLNPYIADYFRGKYILNAFGGNLLSKGMSYAANIHRDIRSCSGTLPLMLNTIVMLDDFHKDNGATWLMHRGHEWFEKPSEREFNSFSFQVVGRAGSIVMFNSNMWHKAGENNTSNPRRSVTPMFCRPFYKQQFDYTQFANSESSDWLKQILGWKSRTPRTLEEWYLPKDKRFYRGDQE